MSSKSSKGPKPKGPRTMEAIKSEYGQTLARAGQLQYEAHVRLEDLKQVNKQLLVLNQEASARIDLDKKNPAVTLPAVETKTETENEA